MEFPSHAEVKKNLENKVFLNAVAESIWLGMSPFRLREVDVHTEFLIDYNYWKVYAAAVLLNGERIAYWLPLLPEDLYPDHVKYKTIHDMCLSFTAVFRNREGAANPHNIILGEN